MYIQHSLSFHFSVHLHLLSKEIYGYRVAKCSMVTGKSLTLPTYSLGCAGSVQMVYRTYFVKTLLIQWWAVKAKQ